MIVYAEGPQAVQNSHGFKINLYILDKETSTLLMKMSESTKLIARHLCIENDLVASGDIK